MATALMRSVHPQRELAAIETDLWYAVLNEEHGVVRLGMGSDPVVGETFMSVRRSICPMS